MIGFVFIDWLCAHKASGLQTIYTIDTYNALYVFASGGFSVPCMVVDLIMSQTTNAMGFYTGYFGHMTKYKCVLHEYPCGFVLGDDHLSIFDD